MTQPDQDPARWDAHVAAYEHAFEPLTDAFNRRALDLLAPLDGVMLLDVAAGAGGGEAGCQGCGRGCVTGDGGADRRARRRAGGSTGGRCGGPPLPGRCV